MGKGAWRAGDEVTETLMCYRLTDSRKHHDRFQARLSRQPDLARRNRSRAVFLPGCCSRRLAWHTQVPGRCPSFGLLEPQMSHVCAGLRQHQPCRLWRSDCCACPCAVVRRLQAPSLRWCCCAGRLCAVQVKNGASLCHPTPARCTSGAPRPGEAGGKGACRLWSQLPEARRL